MSKGREVIFIRALDEEECSDVKPLVLEEMIGRRDAFHALKERDEETLLSQQGASVEVESLEIEVSPESSRVTAEQLEEIQQQAYQEAYDKGLAEGREAGLAQALNEARVQFAQQSAQLQQILEGFAEPIQLLDLEIYDELVSMVLTIAKHLISRELKSDPGQVIAATREALAALPMNSRKIQLHLHPEDAELVRSTLSIADGESAWRVVEDPTLTRGGLKVITENSQVDATIESRLGEIVARVLGDQREADDE